MFDLIAEIKQTLSCNKLRTALTGIAVAWGVFMLIILLGAARGVRNAFEEDWGSEASASIDVWGGMTSTPYKGYKDGRWIRLRNSDIGVIRHDNRHLVADVMATYRLDSTMYGPSDYSTSGVHAVYPGEFEGTSSVLLCGRYLNDRDIAGQRRSIVLEQKDAALFFGDAMQAPGRTVRLMDLAWTVVGVYSNSWRTNAYIPMTTYLAVTGNSDYVGNIEVKIHNVSTEEDADRAEEAVRASLARTHQFDPADKSAVWVWNSFRNYLSGRQAMGFLNMAVWIIGIFTLLTGIVGVSNIMFVSVRERTHEIGVRRAIGAKPRNILTQILAESVAVTALFGYVGVVLGMIVLQVLAGLIGEQPGFSNPTVDISIALEVTVALIIAGSLAGLFPALKAIKVKPVEALRDE